MGVSCVWSYNSNILTVVVSAKDATGAWGLYKYYIDVSKWDTDPFTEVVPTPPAKHDPGGSYPIFLETVQWGTDAGKDYHASMCFGYHEDERPQTAFASTYSGGQETETTILTFATTGMESTWGCRFRTLESAFTSKNNAVFFGGYNGSRVFSSYFVPYSGVVTLYGDNSPYYPDPIGSMGARWRGGGYDIIEISGTKYMFSPYVTGDASEQNVSIVAGVYDQPNPWELTWLTPETGLASGISNRKNLRFPQVVVAENTATSGLIDVVVSVFNRDDFTAYTMRNTFDPSAIGSPSGPWGPSWTLNSGSSTNVLGNSPRMTRKYVVPGGFSYAVGSNIGGTHVCKIDMSDGSIDKSTQVAEDGAIGDYQVPGGMCVGTSNVFGTFIAHEEYASSRWRPVGAWVFKVDLNVGTLRLKKVHDYLSDTTHGPTDPPWGT
jgi:hypothetical protein